MRKKNEYAHRQTDRETDQLTDGWADFSKFFIRKTIKIMIRYF